MSKGRKVDIGSVFEEYLRKEQRFGQEIEKRNRLRRDIRDRRVTAASNSSPTNAPVNLEESHIRNQNLLKDLEMSRARLRTYASYMPTDSELQQISSAYRIYLGEKMGNADS